MEISFSMCDVTPCTHFNTHGYWRACTPHDLLPAGRYRRSFSNRRPSGTPHWCHCTCAYPVNRGRCTRGTNPGNSSGSSCPHPFRKRRRGQTCTGEYTSSPALTAITVAAPVPQLGIAAVVRNKVPAIKVPAPKQTDPELSVNSRLMVCTIHPVCSFFWAPCWVGPGVLEDFHCQRTSDDQDLEIDSRRKSKLVYPSFVAFQRFSIGTDFDLDLSQ